MLLKFVFINVMEFLKLSRVKFAFILTVTATLSACSFLNPFVDRRRNAGVSDIKLLYVGESKIDAPAICYNSWTTNYDEVKKLADEECIKHETGRYAEPVKMSSFTCKLLIPNHVYFRCVK